MRNLVFFLTALSISSFLAPWTLAQDNKENKEFAKFACVSADKLYDRAESCEENALFSRSAENCYRTFVALRKKSNLVLDFHKQESQDRLISQGKEKMAEGKREIDFLLAVSQLGIAELTAYLDSLIYPEDWFEDEVTGGDLEKYLMRVKCFGEPHKRIQEINRQWNKDKSELEAAKTIIEQMMKQTGDYADSLQGNYAAPKVPTKNGPTKPQQGPKGKDYRGSDISGTEELKP